MERLCGLEVTSAEVSRAAQMLDEQLEEWRTRPLGEYKYLLLDTRYEKVRYGGQFVSAALLEAVGISAEGGQREILGVSVSLSEAEVHSPRVLKELAGSGGLHGVQMITSDDHKGLKAALKARFPGVLWQRCQFHLQQNAGSYLPRQSMRKAAAADIRSIFDAPDREESNRRLTIVADKYRQTAPKFADWVETNIPEGLTVFALPDGHRKRLRTTNMLERLNKEIRRRTRVATLFPNEDSLLRLASATSDGNTRRLAVPHCYLNMNQEEEITWP